MRTFKENNAVITKDNLPDGDWKMYQKKVPTKMCRMDGPFEVMTREGVVSCQDGCLAVDQGGYPYPIDISEVKSGFDLVSEEE